MGGRIASGRVRRMGVLIVLGLGLAALPAAAAEKDLTDKGAHRVRSA